MDIYIIQHRLIPLRRRIPLPFQPPGIYIHPPRERPRHQIHHNRQPDKRHRDAERRRVPRRIPRVEQLRTHRAPDLPVTIGEGDRERRPRRALRRLHAPRPHHDVPRGPDAVRDDRRRVHAARAGERVQHGVAGEDDDHEAERDGGHRDACRAREQPEDDGDEHGEDGGRDVQQLGFGDGGEAEVGDDGGLVELQARGADGEEGPAEEEEPDADVLEGGEQLAEAEVGFGGAGGVAGEAGLDEGFFAVGEPGGC